MRLQRIQIENYRRLPDLEISVAEHLVLVGASDAGKTSVLRALHLLLGLAQAQLVPSIELRDFTDPSLPFIVEVDLVNFGDADRATFPDQIHVDADGAERLRLRLEAEIDQEDPDLRTVRRTFPDVIGGKQVARAQLDHIGWVLLRSDRSLQRELGSAGTGAFKTLLSQTDLGAELSQILEAIDGLHQLLADSESLATVRSGVAQGLSSMLPLEVSAEDLLLLTGSDAAKAPLADVLLHLSDGDGEIAPISEQSDGMRSVALLTLLSLSAAQSGLTGIDEPELHLHPTAQAALGETLRRSGRQHILATHSGRLAAAFPASDLVCLSSSRGARNLSPDHEVQSEVFHWRWWTHELVETLTSRVCLFVEGASDRILLQAVARQTGVRLARDGIHVIELDGASSFGRMVEVIGESGYGIPCVGLCDEDASDEWADALGVAVEDLGANGYLVNDPDLEGEVVEALGVDRFLELIRGSPLVSDRSLLNSTGAVSVSEITREDAADYFRRKRNKVPVATALATRMTADDAQAIEKLSAVLDEARRVG